MDTPEAISEIFGPLLVDAYCTAAKTGLRMRAVTSALESLREKLAVTASYPEIFTTWSIFNQQIGLSESQGLTDLLVNLREEYSKNVIGRAVRGLNRAFEQDPSQGWKQWLQAYVESFCPFNFFSNFSRAISEQALPYSPDPAWPVERIRECARLVEASRWAEVYDWFVYLSGQKELPEILRGRILAIAASIQLYIFTKINKAKAMIDEAINLAHGDLVISEALGRYYLESNNLESAKEFYDSYIEKLPSDADGFLGIAEYYDRLNDNDSAVEYYRQAVQNSPGSNEAHLKLMNWYGRADQFAEHQDQVQELSHQLLNLEHNQFEVWNSLGLIYKQNGMLDDASSCFQKSYELNNEYIDPLVWMGYISLDKQDYRQAQNYFESTIRQAPAAIEGYWGLITLNKQRSDWQTSLDWLDRSSGVHTEWQSQLLAARAELLSNLSRYEESLSVLKQALELDPESVTALQNLDTLADSYRGGGNVIVSLEALNHLKRFKGPDFEANYNNRLGNLNYYRRDYASAASCYRAALALDSKNAVYRSNLSLALEGMQTPGSRTAELSEAVSQLEQAHDLDPAEAEYPSRLEALKGTLNFIRSYGEPALELTPVVRPVQVKVSSSILPEILDSEQELAQETLASVDRMRDRFKDKYGVSIPSIHYTTLDDSASQEGQFDIYIGDLLVDTSFVKPGMRYLPSGAVDGSNEAGSWVEPGDRSINKNTPAWTVSEYILYKIEAQIDAHLADVISFDDLVFLLSQCGATACKDLYGSPDKYVPYVRLMKQLLLRRVPVTALDKIAEVFLRHHAENVKTETILDALLVELRLPQVTARP